MGPKNEAVMCKDASVKEFSWIDRMYQKLESICVEVDKNPNLLFQETTKYVENQMNAVRSNVRKFCTELIEDLLPPLSLSSDALVKEPDLLERCDSESMGSDKLQNKESLIPDTAVTQDISDRLLPETPMDQNTLDQASETIEKKGSIGERQADDSGSRFESKDTQWGRIGLEAGSGINCDLEHRSYYSHDSGQEEAVLEKVLSDDRMNLNGGDISTGDVSDSYKVPSAGVFVLEAVDLMWHI
eukprot:c23964_g1_i2 orf=538-1266(-)